MVVRTTPCTRGKTKCEILKFYLLDFKCSLANFLPLTQLPIENKTPITPKTIAAAVEF